MTMYLWAKATWNWNTTQLLAAYTMPFTVFTFSDKYVIYRALHTYDKKEFVINFCGSGSANCIWGAKTIGSFLEYIFSFVGK